MSLKATKKLSQATWNSLYDEIISVGDRPNGHVVFKDRVYAIDYDVWKALYKQFTPQELALDSQEYKARCILIENSVLEPLPPFSLAGERTMDAQTFAFPSPPQNRGFAQTAPQQQAPQQQAPQQQAPSASNTPKPSPNTPKQPTPKESPRSTYSPEDQIFIIQGQIRKVKVDLKKAAASGDMKRAQHMKTELDELNETFANLTHIDEDEDAEDVDQEELVEAIRSVACPPNRRMASGGGSPIPSQSKAKKALSKKKRLGEGVLID